MVRDRPRWLVPVALALLLVLAGCSGGSSGDAGGPATEAGYEMEAEETVAEEREDSADGQSQDAQNRQRALVRTGTVEVTVDEYEASRANLTRTTRDLGGYVSDTGEQVHTRDNQSWTDGELVLRVPQENFSTLLDAAKQSGEVERASTSTEDVTDQLVDLDARLENLRSQRDQLRELYEEANDTETVLQVQQRLSEVQTEIERLEAQRESLERRVAYSTLTVRLNERPPEPTETIEPDAWHETGLTAAFVSSLYGVVAVARGLAVGVAYVTPYLLAFGVPIAGVVAFWRRHRSRAAEPDLQGVRDSTGDSELTERPKGHDDAEPDDDE